MTVPACLVAVRLSGQSTMTAPDAPTIGAATGGDGQATVSFTPPADDGGALITGYTATSSPGGLTGTGSSSPIVVSGLTNGTEYTFTVTATNGVGTGSASAASDPVTPTPTFTLVAVELGAGAYGFVSPAGSVTPDSLFGQTITELATDTGTTTVGILGNQAQTFFTSITVGAVTLLTVDAVFSPGTPPQTETAWQWTSDLIPAAGTYTVTIV